MQWHFCGGGILPGHVENTLALLTISGRWCVQDLPALEENEDTQMHLAMMLLREKSLGPTSPLWAKLQTLPEVRRPSILILTLVNGYSTAWSTDQVSFSRLYARSSFISMYVRVSSQRVPVCWGWSEDDRKMLAGTDLDVVVSRKLSRLRKEFDEHVARQMPGCSFDTYVETCTSVISHANPW
jgi:hypothetical protein